MAVKIVSVIFEKIRRKEDQERREGDQCVRWKREMGKSRGKVRGEEEERLAISRVYGMSLIRA